MVDPTGLKPVPHGLKGRCSVTRAPGQCWSKVQCPKSNVRVSTADFGQLDFGLCMAVAEGFEPSHGRINSAVPYRLGYATTSKDKVEG
jgi:hypothetical protein